MWKSCLVVLIDIGAVKKFALSGDHVTNLMLSSCRIGSSSCFGSCVQSEYSFCMVVIGCA